MPQALLVSLKRMDLNGMRNSIVQPPTDAPDSLAAFRVGTWRDQEVVHRPVMVRTERHAVSRFVVLPNVERNDVRGLH